MSVVEEILEDLEKIKNKMISVGETFMKEFPQSSMLYRFSKELDLAADGVEALMTDIEETSAKARNENNIKNDIEDQMAEFPYDALSNEEKNKLSEYLVQQQAPLADDVELLTGLTNSMSGAETSEVIKRIAKDYLIELGNKKVPEEMRDNDFDPYVAGVEDIEELLASEQKAEFLGVLAKEYMKRMPAKVIKEFYSKVGW